MASLISIMSSKVKDHGGINLAQGIPGFEPPIQLLDILSKLVHNEIHQYAPASGNLQLVKSILEKYSTFATFQPENLLITNGATEAISLIYTYLNRKHKKLTVLGFDPVYETYSNLPKIFGDEFIAFALNDNLVVDFEQLEKKVIAQKVNLIFINTPGNPLGKIWTKQEFEKLLNIIHKYNVYLIIDAVYREIYFKSEAYIPFEYFSENIFYVNSFSKLFSITGWRLGYFFMHTSHSHQIRSIHDYIGLCANSVMQQAVYEYVNMSDFGRNYVEKMREKIANSYNLLYESLLEFGFTAPRVEGGYFIWAKLPETYTNGYDFAMELYDKEQVAVVPGEHFSSQGKAHIRINIARNLPEIYKSIAAFKHFFADNSESARLFKRMTSIKTCHC